MAEPKQTCTRPAERERPSLWQVAVRTRGAGEWPGVLSNRL